MSQLVSRPAGVIADVPQSPLITAVLVTRNKESYIRECLCGLMEQSTADRMEVIVVDQGSEQSEWSVVADLQRRYPNLISLRTAAAKGVSAGLNLALKIAAGKYITVIEATDRLKEDAYELLASTLEANPDAMLAYGDTCFTAIPHESFANHTSYGKMIWPDYTFQQLSQLSLIAPHLMWRRDLHDSIGGFDERYESQGMRDFLLRVVGSFRMVHIEEFTGLKLVAAGAPLNQDASERELASLKQNYQAAARQPAAAPQALQFNEPAPAAPAQASQPAQVAQPAQQPARPASIAAAAPIAQFSRPAAATAAAPVAQASKPAPAPSAEEAYAKIQTLVNSGSDQQATEALASHLGRYPQHALAHNDLAAISYRLGDTEAALRHYRTAVQLNPNEATYLKNLADLSFVATGQADEAIGIYLKLLKSTPRDIETLLNLGIICESVGQPTEAESFYQRALEIEPWNQTVRQRITELRLRLAEPEPCEEEESAEELYEKAQALVAQGDLDAACRELEAILKFDPDFPLAHNDLAVIYYQQGAKDQAQLHYEKAAALAPKNSTFQKNLADFYFVEGRDVDGAIAIYLGLLQKEPRNIETLMNLGKICTMLDRPEEAKSFYNKVTQLEPWNRDARECLTTLRQCANG
jgi:Flp pilus assembly protein TadD